MKIILLAGKAFSGKSMVAHLLKNKFEQLKMRTVITEYSKYIKLYAKEMLGVKETDEKPRKFLQEMGTYIRENIFDENFFVNRMLEDLKVYEKYFDIVVISDVRLKNEIEEMKKSPYSVLTIYIESQRENTLTEEEKKHITEHELENYQNFDYRIKLENQEDILKFAKQIIEGEK